MKLASLEPRYISGKLDRETYEKIIPSEAVLIDSLDIVSRMEYMGWKVIAALW